MAADIFTDDVKFEPYWWDAAPRPKETPPELPARTDVAVVGSGYSGLSAALTLARGGRDVTVFEAGAVGPGPGPRAAAARGGRALQGGRAGRAAGGAGGPAGHGGSDRRVRRSR